MRFWIKGTWISKGLLYNLNGAVQQFPFNTHYTGPPKVFAQIQSQISKAPLIIK